MNMAKTIMISNELYEELKRRKGERSFSELIKESLDRRKAATLRELVNTDFGLPKDDTEYDEVMKELKEGWKKFNERMRKNLEENSA